MLKFTINIAPRTKKNSQRIVVVKNKPMIIPSKLYKDYERDCKYFVPKIDTINYPINLV